MPSTQPGLERIVKLRMFNAALMCIGAAILTDNRPKFARFGKIGYA
jgi:hypothetical protein